MLWAPLQHEWQEEALKAQLRRWAWTPYMRGQNLAGVGTTCVGFVVGVLQGLTGVEFPVPSRPPTAIRHLRDLRLSDERVWPDEGVMPADILIAGPEEQLHLYLACLVRGQWWHCGVSSGVAPTSTPKLKQPLRRLLRPTGKSLWIPCAS